MSFIVPKNIPDGQYVGTWSGHEIRWLYGGKSVCVETVLGIRGTAGVRFIVKAGQVLESSIEQLPRPSE